MPIIKVVAATTQAHQCSLRIDLQILIGFSSMVMWSEIETAVHSLVSSVAHTKMWHERLQTRRASYVNRIQQTRIRAKSSGIRENGGAAAKGE
jgi:hypothetical protein